MSPRVAALASAGAAISVEAMPEQPDSPPITLKELAIWLNEYYAALRDAGFDHAWSMEYLIGLSKSKNIEE